MATRNRTQTAKERIADLKNEIAEIRKLKEQVEKDYSKDELGDSKSGPLFLLDQKIRDKLKELAKLEIKIIEGRDDARSY